MAPEQAYERCLDLLLAGGDGAALAQQASAARRGAQARPQAPPDPLAAPLAQLQGLLEGGEGDVTEGQMRVALAASGMDVGAAFTAISDE